MKHYLLWLSLILFIFPILCFGQKNPTIVFDKDVCDFGTVKYKPNSVIKIKFFYVNKGAGPLVIYNVDTSCDCTIPNWTKKPIPIGGRDYISVVFKIKGKLGIIRKSIFVNTNCLKKEITLNIKGIVN
jgi:hypothetical protein